MSACKEEKKYRRMNPLTCGENTEWRRAPHMGEGALLSSQTSPSGWLPPHATTHGETRENGASASASDEKPSVPSRAALSSASAPPFEVGTKAKPAQTSEVEAPSRE